MGDSLFNRGGVAQARYCMPPTYPPHSSEKPTLRGMGGGDRGCLPWRRPSTALHVAYPPPTTPSCPGKINVAQALHVPYPHQRTRPSWNGGRRDRGCSPWRCPRTALQVAYPPLEKPTICEMGGGEGGVHIGVAQARHCMSYPPPYPPPHVRDNSKLKMRLTPIFGDIPKAADNALTQRRLWKTAVGHCGERWWWRRQQRLTTTADCGCGQGLGTTTAVARG